MKLSVVAICKNEAKNVIPWLKSFGMVADEIVVVDTGSWDGTQELFKKYGFKERTRKSELKLRHFQWNDNFSDARNFAKSHATGDWILWADLDDRLETDAPGFISAIKQHEPDCALGFQMASETEQPGVYVRMLQIRMFPNHPKIRWERSIHEHVLGSIQALGLTLEPVPDCVILHVGNTDPALKRVKALRNAKLLEDMEEESFERYSQLGDAYYTMGSYDLGIINYYKARGLAEADYQRWSITERIVLGRLCMGEKESAESEIPFLKEGSMSKKFWTAELAKLKDDLTEAVTLFNEITEMTEDLSSLNSYEDAYKSQARKRLAQIKEIQDAEERRFREQEQADGNNGSKDAEAKAHDGDPADGQRQVLRLLNGQYRI